MADQIEDRPFLVTLLNGASAPTGRVISTLGNLRYLVSTGHSGQLLLRCLYRICKRGSGASVPAAAIRNLAKLDLLDADGRPPEGVRDIILSALIRRSKGSPLLTVRMPYLESDPKNDAAVGAALERIFEGLGQPLSDPTTSAVNPRDSNSHGR